MDFFHGVEDLVERLLLLVDNLLGIVAHLRVV